MEDYNYLTYEELKNLKKGTVIMHRDEFRNRKWCIGTFLGHNSAYGSAAMKFSFHADKKENPDYKWTTVFTGLQFYEHAWNDFGQWLNYRWPSEEELNADLLERLS